MSEARGPKPSEEYPLHPDCVQYAELLGIPIAAKYRMSDEYRAPRQGETFWDRDSVWVAGFDFTAKYPIMVPVPESSEVQP